MSVFKEAKAVKEVDDTLTTVSDFNRQVPFWSYRNVGYKDYEPFERVRPELDAYLEKLFSGDIDDGNGDVLDSIILDYTRMAIEDLLRQQVDHCDLIKQLYLQAEGAKDAYMQHLKRMDESLGNAYLRLDEIEHRLKKNEFDSCKKTKKGDTDYE